MFNTWRKLSELSSASNVALLRLHSALCRIPGATIPESHAGHRGVFGKTLTSDLAPSGDGDGDIGDPAGGNARSSIHLVFGIAMERIRSVSFVVKGL